MNKIKTLKAIIVALVLLNIALITFIFLKPHPRPNENKSAAKLKELFGFNEEQMAKFEVSRDLHKDKIKPLNEKLGNSAVKYYLSQDSLQKEIAYKEVLSITNEIYKANGTHINDLRTMAGNGKDKEMEEFIKSLIMPRQRPPRPDQENQPKKGH